MRHREFITLLGGAALLRFAVLLLVATISTARAEQIETRTILGPLGFSCGKWINAPEHTGERAQLRQWILGYLSGLNMESSTDFLQGRDADSLLAWIDNYCRRNPLHVMPQAILALTNELQTGRGKLAQRVPGRSRARPKATPVHDLARRRGGNMARLGGALSQALCRWLRS